MLFYSIEWEDGHFGGYFAETMQIMYLRDKIILFVIIVLGFGPNSFVELIEIHN